MTKNPLLNAATALGYIILVVSVMNFLSKYADQPDSYVAPIAFLSMFTLSAAVMASIFGYQPAQLYFNGKKKEGVRLFLQTLVSFAALTALVVMGLLIPL